MKRVELFVLVWALSGCHHQAPRVDCDKYLVPINAPAPVVKPSAYASGRP